ncbi:MAG: 4-hydroxy-tetrahydrodipicolinate synthase [Candidatus Limimorpha sp.]
MKNNPFVGTGVALITPFNEDFSVDYQSLKNIVDFTLQNGADFLVALGTTSEAPTLTPDEKNKVLDTIVKTANNRCPIILGLGGNNTQNVIENIKNQSFDGIDGMLSVVPYYNKPNQNGMLAHFNAIADASPVPVVLYNVPGRVGVNMQASTTIALAKHKNIIAIKEASGNIQQIMEVLRDKPSDFDVLSGDDGITQPLMSLGATGVISVAANAYPKLFCEMVHNMLDKMYDKALSIHYRLLKMNGLLFADGNPAGVKALMSHIGLCKNVLRLPLVSVSENVFENIKNEYQNLI